MDRSIVSFPVWLELSGLPAALNEASKTGFAWAVFRKIVELDMELHPHRPGIVEVPLGELASRCGLDAARVVKSAKAMRKLGLVRTFLPDEEEEHALFEVLCPIPTPQSADDVRASHPDLFLESEWPPRYAVEYAATEAEAQGGRGEKIKRVVELYLNVFSMKMNAIILDQLQLISDRYDMELIEKVFARGRKRESVSLGWIISEIRRETKARQKGQEIRRGHGDIGGG